MAQQVDQQAGLWWRFDRYEFFQGFIRPARNARLIPYDPWAAYRQTRTNRKELTPPYVTLLHLLHELKKELRTRGDSPGFTARGETALLRWCNQHGLLGVLLHRTHAVTLAPQNGDNGARQYVRAGFGWVWVTGGEAGSPSVFLQDWGRHTISSEPLNSTWGTFFPQVPADAKDTYPYPLPATDEFWSIYAEPVSAFLEAASVLQDAAEFLRAVVQKEGHRKPHIKTAAEATDKEVASLAVGHHLLSSLISRVRPGVFVSDDGAFHQKWTAPSLLAYFAMQLLQDLTEGRLVQECSAPDCSQVFVSSAYQAAYCSTRCRNRVQKQDLRSKQATARRLHAEGVSIEDIATRLDTATGTVWKWVSLQ